MQEDVLFFDRVEDRGVGRRNRAGTLGCNGASFNSGLSSL
jgi:hypothetical protein